MAYYRLSINNKGKIVTIIDSRHYPNNPEMFVFDDEVSRIFPDMARRSIPMYTEVHRLHASMIFNYRPCSIYDPMRVCDIGASRGEFFVEMCRQCSLDPATGAGYLSFVAIDSSEPMLSLLSCDMPWVTTICADALALPELEEQADVISMLYLLQFIKDGHDKLSVLQWAYRNLKPGGMLILGQKENPTRTYAEAFYKLYYEFRRRNGYTPEEIEAKNKALAGSMWPDRVAWIEDQCYRAGFIDYTETTRWLQFSTSVCTKGVV